MRIDENTTIKELLDSGANIDINYHDNKNMNDAYKIMKNYRGFGSIKKDDSKGTSWLQIKKPIRNNHNRLIITAFY